jgi:thiamine pyrophosphokinase
MNLPNYPAPGPESLVVAVDGGARHCLKKGWPTHVLIGDFDSLDLDALSLARERCPSAEVLSYDSDKDETDFELALDLVLKRHSVLPPLEVLGAMGGRPDMFLANLLLPLAETFRRRIIRRRRQAEDVGGPLAVFLEADWSLHLLSGPAEMTIQPVDRRRRVSLLPLTAKAKGVTLAGAFRYPLTRGELRFGLTLGLSNELPSCSEGTIRLEKGLLLATVSDLT